MVVGRGASSLPTRPMRASVTLWEEPASGGSSGRKTSNWYSDSCYQFLVRNVWHNEAGSILLYQCVFWQRSANMQKESFKRVPKSQNPKVFGFWVPFWHLLASICWVILGCMFGNWLFDQVCDTAKLFADVVAEVGHNTITLKDRHQ